MNSKTGYKTFALFAFVLLSLSFVPATTSTVFSISNINIPTSVDETAGSFTFTFDLEYTGNSADMSFTFDTSTTSLGTLSIPAETGFDGTVNEKRTITGTVSGITNNDGGNSATVNIIAISGSGSTDDETFFSVPINNVDNNNNNNNGNINLCPAGEVGDLEIKDFNVDNKGEGDDEEWFPLDEIEIEIEIENNDGNNQDVEDVTVEIFVFDSSGNDVTGDFDFEDEEIDYGDIDEDEETEVFEIFELPADIDEGNYDIYVKAYSDGAEEEHCTSVSNDFNQDDFHEIDYERIDDNAIIVTDDDLFSNNPIAQCGENGVEVSFPVYNVGKDKEDEVLINLYNPELDIDEFIHIGSLSEGKKKTVTFNFDVPNNAESKVYELDVITYYDFDNDEDELDASSYDQNSNDDLNEDFEINLDVVSCKVPNPSVGANLASNADVGEELVVDVTVSSNSDDTNYAISLSGVNSWADIVSVSPSSFSLDAGESKDVTVTLLPTKGGTQTFSLNTVFDGQTFEKPVTVSVSGQGSTVVEGTNSNSGSNIFDEETDGVTRWLVIGIIALVALIFLTLVVRMATRGSRSGREEF